MQIRGEAAIACGFMAGLATGLLFDGCFDSYINRFCDSAFPRGWPRKTAPARQKADAPIKSRSVAASKTKVIVIKNGKIYHRSGGCKTFLKMPLEQACHWRPCSNEERPPVQYVARQRLRRFFGGVLQGHGSLRIHGFKNVSARHGTLTLPPCSAAAACTQTTIL